VIFVYTHLQCRRASLVEGSSAVFPGERENSQDASYAYFALLAIDKVAESTDLYAYPAGAPEQLHYT
jgi:hypothetical protein